MNKVYLVRHGQTAWTKTLQHTSFTDLDLTEEGEQEVLWLKNILQEVNFAHVYTSPLLRALHTCELTGYKYAAEQHLDLIEWNYGIYEGLRTQDIHQENPEWNLFLHGAPHGESVEQIEKRAHRVKAVLLHALQKGNVLLFSSGHFLRVLASSWINKDASFGAKLALHTASLSILGWERNESVIELWNKTSHRS